MSRQKSLQFLRVFEVDQIGQHLFAMSDIVLIGVTLGGNWRESDKTTYIISISYIMSSIELTPIDNPKQSSNIQKTGVTAGFLLPFVSVTEPAEVGELLRAIDGFRGTFVVQCALRLAPLFFVRPGELRKAQGERA